MNTTLEQTKQQTATIRVVFDGAPFAGKTTAAYSLSSALGGSAITPAEEDGRTVWFDWLSYSAGRHDGQAIRVELVTVPGQEHLAARRRHLLTWGDVVVFIADTRRDAFPASVAKFNELRQDLEGRGDVPIVVIANKRDLADALPINEVAHQLELTDSDSLVEGIATSGGGIQEAFIFAVRAALANPTTPVEPTTADELLEEMQAALAEADSPSEVDAAADEAFDELQAALAETTVGFDVDASADEAFENLHAAMSEADPTYSVTTAEAEEVSASDDEVFVDDVEAATDVVSDDEAFVDDVEAATDVVSDDGVLVDGVGAATDVVSDDEAFVDDVEAATDVVSDDEVLVDDVEVATDDVSDDDEPVGDDVVVDELVAEAPASDDHVEEVEAVTTPTTDRIVHTFINARLNPDGISDGGAIVVLAEHWRVLVDVANGRTELPIGDGTTEGAITSELASWGLIVGDDQRQSATEEPVNTEDHETPTTEGAAPMQGTTTTPTPEHRRSVTQ